ncbi:hypothetical protein LQR31_09990 [Chromobacterium vaccinii]|uniref:hypothetical protein n=1 Tax=Chromobacterium vaccinii TaxID=1108595 RepID=UPI001E5D22EA|nr:hypothetical protein [Chromobacterium vaccinii]MCD4484802.1 hypothetical protein [Chromobacterium vaccinii]
MVTKLLPPEEDSVDLVSRIIEERVHYRGFYDGIKQDLISRVKLYKELQGNPESISPINLRSYTNTDEEAAQRKTSLIGLYSPKEDKLPYSQLEHMRKNNGLVVCPSCGEPGRPRTLDHYLPKDIFPEFSVVLLNLTPMCDWCQGEKLAEYITNDGFKRYIHPYFDDVDRPLFSIIFKPPYITPIIDISISNEMPVELQRLVALHLEGVDFLTRFKEFFKTKFRNVLRIARKCREPESIKLREFLQECLEMEAFNSKNSWDVIVYRSILTDEQMMGYLETGELPEHL